MYGERDIQQRLHPFPALVVGYPRSLITSGCRCLSAYYAGGHGEQAGRMERSSC